MGYGFGQLNEYAERVYANAKEKGFWQDDPSQVSTRLAKLMLVTTEVAEAAEAARVDDAENWAEELADIVIRVMDLAVATRVNLEQEVCNKIERNASRPRMHGKLA